MTEDGDIPIGQTASHFLQLIQRDMPASSASGLLSIVSRGSKLCRASSTNEQGPRNVSGCALYAGQAATQQ